MDHIQQIAPNLRKKGNILLVLDTLILLMARVGQNIGYDFELLLFEYCSQFKISVHTSIG